MRAFSQPLTAAVGPLERDFRERRLEPKLSGILNWAIEGAVRYLREGLVLPKSVQEATSEYRTDQDVVGQWIDERCDLDPRATTPTGQAYADYQQWGLQEHGVVLKKLTFRRYLTDQGFGAPLDAQGKRVRGAHGQQLIAGLVLRYRSPLAVVPGGRAG